MTSLGSPSAAYRTILARMTSRYGDVYLRAIASRLARSSFVNSTSNGLFLGIHTASAAGGEGSMVPGELPSIIRHRIYEFRY